ncbi:MAG TPA: hypothetical protein VIH61_06100, partial [Waddliaceae bacterium]
MFIGALRRMEMRGFIPHVIHKKHQEGKWTGWSGSTVRNPGKDTEYHSSEWSDNELKEMQKDLGRSESLKLPEAASDNPQAVFDQQIEDFQQIMKEAGEECEFSSKDLSHQFRKEELTDLLYMLRRKHPQVEAVAFLKTHPHLLSNSDVRHYLEIVLFDPSGSSLADAFDYNHEFFKTLPDVLEEEVRKYCQLIVNEPAYTDQLLFIASLARKFQGIYHAHLNTHLSKRVADNLISPEQFQEIQNAAEKLKALGENIFGKNKIHDQILQNPDLHAYHYRAALEYLFNQLSNGYVKKEEFSNIICVYHKLQALSRDIYDVDLSEVETLNRHYALFINSLPQRDLPILAPLLDRICTDQFLPLDHSQWKGKFPVYSNDQYEVNVLSGQIIDYLSGGQIVSMPEDAKANPAYKSAFGDVDLKTMRVRLTKQANREVYLIEDKAGVRGRVEEQEGNFRFYKQFPGREKPLQALFIKETDNDKQDDTDKNANINEISAEKYRSYHLRKGEENIISNTINRHIYPELPDITNVVKTLQSNKEAGDELAALRSLARGCLFFDPEVPDEGLCFDDEGVLQFKIKINGTREIQVIDCRGKKESKPYQVHSLESISHDDLKNLEQFESRKDILIFCKQDKLKKVEFLRYGLSFTLKKGRLMCDHPKYQGYFIDFNASETDKGGIPFSLALRHQDEEMPMKLILPDPSVLKNETTQKEKSLSLIDKLWVLGKAIFKKEVNPDEFTEEVRVYGPQHTEEKTLKYHVFTIRPYTGELLPAETKDKMATVLALLEQVLLNKESRLALKPLKQLKIVPGDLSKRTIDQMLKFLQISDGGEAASIKLQLALKLKEVMGERVRFQRASENLDNLIVKQCECYLRQGRKMDQRLCLDRAQFELMASIVKKTDEKFFDQNLRLFFVNQGELPQFSSEDGTPIWKGYADINLDEKVQDAKEKGYHGIEQIPLEVLEKRLKPYVKAPLSLDLKPEGTPLLYKDDAEIDSYYSYFKIKPITIPDVKLPQIEENAPSCERKAVEQLKAEMEKYRDIVQGRQKYFLKTDQILTLKEKIVEAHNTHSEVAAQKK